MAETIDPIALSEISALTQAGFVVDGAADNDMSGWSVAAVGDVNGDGLDDLIIGAPGGETSNGKSYVVFGKSSADAVDLAAIEAGDSTLGFLIQGGSTDLKSGSSVSGVGDVNGDGLADLLIGTNFADDTEGTLPGQAYIVYGKASGSTINLDALTSSQGVSLNGENNDDAAGYSISGLGDVNGDGLADFIVSAPYFGNPDQALVDAGRSYVVFGSKTLPATLNLSAIAAGTGGFAVNGAYASEFVGSEVSAIGDINGDGLADIAVSSHWGNPFKTEGNDFEGVAGAGSTYVIFGKSTTTAVDLSAIENGQGGFLIGGETSNDFSGCAVSAAGDVNGDGYADLIIGAYRHSATGSSEGRSYVVFGGNTLGAAINLAEVANGNGGFVIDGEATGDQSGRSVSGIGDINGDGLADLLVGASAATSNTGKAYVVFGKRDGGPVDLTDVSSGVGGFALTGNSPDDKAAWSVAAAGDINGDGLADLLVGAPGEATASGRTYVLFGATDGSTGASAVDVIGSNDDDVLYSDSSGKTLLGGAGNDTIYGAGGCDVMYGGTGNDLFCLDAMNITALQETAASGRSARTSGGAGLDTISLLSSNLILDLTQIGNQGAGLLDLYSSIESIERIDITGTGTNTLSFAANDISDISGMGAFSGSTWVPTGSGYHQVVIDADADDTVIFSGAWRLMSGSINNTENSAGLERSYRVYTDQEAATQVIIGASAKLSLTGSSSTDLLETGSGNDTLDGGIGADTLKGGAGDDSYYIDNSADSIVENASSGSDTVYSSITFALGNYLENLTLLGSAKINATGNSLANRLTGNSGANRLDGGIGADTMSGGGGADTYIVDNTGDVARETSTTGGTDTVLSSVNYTLGSNLENLTLTGTALNATGNSLANLLTGNASANVLNGMTGADTMDGGAGNDTYYVDNSGDVINELSASGGTDTVISSRNFTLGNYLENLTLSGSSLINGTGNTLANSLSGNSGANRLDGKTGADTLSGGDGDDTLIGGEGSDVLIGGDGNDIYYVDNTGDKVTESSSSLGGKDLVISSVTKTLGSYQEDLTLTGSAALSGFGNTLANVLVGNDGANLLNASSGNDTLYGGAGNDTLCGSTGKDTLYGGSGNDYFSFDSALNANTNLDMIADFSTTYDTIQLENAIFKKLTTTGTLSSGMFRSGANTTTATDSNDYILYNKTTGALYYDADGSGSAYAPIKFAIIGSSTHAALTYADFQVV